MRAVRVLARPLRSSLRTIRFLRSRYLNQSGGDVREVPTAWEAGTASEVEFWTRWLATKGLHWPDEYARRLNPKAPFSARASAELERMNLERAKVLDVGAGPITNLGYVHPHIEIDLTACDPLAEHYARIMREARVEPPIPTVRAGAETLTDSFPPDTFDIVHCNNALDHSLNPLQGILQMLAVTKPGGCVMLIHERNEGESQKYQGLHQFNFDSVNGRFTIWNSANYIDVGRHLPASVSIDTSIVDKCVVVVLQKGVLSQSA